ncbi:MAG: ERF family protein [Candidatus Pacearchaeota archaeon]
MKNLYKALASFQQECPVILKDTSGYGYKYADLPAIFEVINPLLKKNGLGFTQPINGNKIKTILFHIESGEVIESETDMPFDSLTYEESIKSDKDGNQYTAFILRGFEGMNKAQAIGSLITYFRRYSLSSLLGLITDKDTDASQPPKIYNEGYKEVAQSNSRFTRK